MALSRHIDLAYADAYEAARPGLPGSDLPWLGKLRAEALARFREEGLPTQRVEAWKYTNLQPLAKAGFAPSQGAEGSLPAHLADALILPQDAQAHKLVFMNGRFRPELSELGPLPAGVTLMSLAEALAGRAELVEPHLGRIAAPNGHALISLNTAFMGDGLLLHVPDGTALERPVHVIFAGLDEARPAAFHPRLLLVIGAGGQATVMESHAGAEGARYWSNPVAEIAIGRDATLHHYKVQAESTSAMHLASTKARLAQGGRYDSYVMSLGARLSRNEIEVVFAGAGGECRLNGGYMMGGRQHVDNTTLIDHAEPHCTSREVYKGVLDERSRGVFQGKIVVRAGAQKTDGHMLSKTLLLSDEAEIDSKPELEIYADDVKCGHGATAGEIEEDALFYLRARGIDREAARNMLIEAFLQEIVDEIDYAPARILLHGQVSGWLEARNRSR